MRAACALLLIAIAAPARAGVVVGAGVPFSADELEWALAARTRDEARFVVDVQAIAPDRLRVVSPSGRWDVDVGASRGPAAARLVALNVLGDDVGEAGPPLDGGDRRWAVMARAGASRGIGAADLATSVVGVELTVGRRWWISGGLEWRAGVETSPAGAAPVDDRLWLVRGLVGRTLGGVELAVGPVAGQLRVDSPAGATAWMIGGALVARTAVAIAPRWSLVVGFDGDIYRHRIEVRRAGEVVASTPRAALAATVGLRRELGR